MTKFPLIDTLFQMATEQLPEYLVVEWKQIQRYYLEDRWPGQNVFSAEELDLIRQDVERLSSGVPLAHVTGIAHFYGKQLKVNSNVLIPRPETEELVEWVLQSASKDAKVLDIGTGSGCIACILAGQRPDLQVFAMDISSEALEIARKNADSLEVDVSFLNDDILQSSEELQSMNWDLIVSNPPYVKPSELDGSVLAEPKLALLTPEKSPLLYYRAVASYAKSSLLSGGQLFFECSEFHAEDTRDYLEQEGWKNITLRKDLQGKWRMLKATK
jgi:release factor glutamine methyltransferase